MFRGRRTVQTLILAMAATLALSARAETFMTVSDVPVDVTAKDAAAARDQAIAVAQSKAFDRLIKRLVPNPSDQARLHPSQQDIEGFVQDFGVENERVSMVRYIGLYSVRFRESRIRKYLSDSGVGGVGDQQQVLVVPIYKTQAGTMLWESGNGWRVAWDRGGLGDGPVTLILPNGDNSDTGTLTAEAAANGDTSAFGALMQRYHAAGVALVVAEPRDLAKGAASGLSLNVTTYDQGGAKGTQALKIDPVAGEQSDKALTRGVVAVADALESGWRQSIASGGSTGLAAPSAAQSADQPLPGGAITPYPVGVSVAGVEGWVRLRNQLAGTPGIQRVELDALTREEAALTLDFSGDVVALQAALSGSGYVLVQTAPGNAAGPGAFQLRLAGAEPPPARQFAGPPPMVPPPPGPAQQ
jgi:hypothetical protein